MVVLNSKPLQFKILEFIHNSPVAGHPSYIKICLSMQNIYLQKDFLYKEIRSTLTITNSNIKMA
jgi:hypothetical protein